ncbi:MAG: MOSC domain-containing protein [Geminicoccaceae bacterium]|nr:MAG: MOSC domain-containing protein [Geminicoccaceae bacterium]
MVDVQGRIAGLFVYPIKGCAAVPLASAALEAKGLAHDRRYAVVTPSGRVLTQREHPALARIHCSIGAEGGLRVQIEGVRFDVDEAGVAAPLTARVWGDEVLALPVEGPVGEALADLVGAPVKLVRFAPEARRACDPTVAPLGAETAFADGFPVLVTNESSLVVLDEWLLERGAEPVGMDRFRPNVVLADMPAWAEDDHDRLVVAGGAMLDLVKPCDRCIVTTIDQETGEPHGDQPLAMLRQMRLHPILRKPVFGQNAVPRLAPGETAVLTVGARAELVGSART